ncbi:hypothetical protein ES707_18864 [subsurface metagenome]
MPFEDPRSIEPLKELLRHETDKWERIYAARLLKRMGQEIPEVQ